MIEKTFDFSKTTEQNIDVNYLSTFLSYKTEKIEVVEIDRSNKRIRLRFSGSEAKLNRIIKKIMSGIGREVLKNKQLRIYERNAKGKMNNASTWNELIKLGYVFEYGKGHNGYKGLFLDVVNTLDSVLVGIAKKMNAVEVYLPNFIPCKYLTKLGLVDEYPHYLFFTTYLKKKKRKVANFQYKYNSKNFSFKKYLSEPESCLKTSACSLLYPLIENTKFDSLKYYTVLGHCTRNELSVQSFERLTEFNMREIIYIGNERGSKKFQQIALKIFEDIFVEFDLTGDVSIANDSFFITNYDKLKLAQILGCDKYEANVYIPETHKNISVGSFNNHHNFFSKRFHFSMMGEEAITSCVGFGLERLAYGIISQHGINKEKIFLMIDKFKQNYFDNEKKFS